MKNNHWNNERNCNNIEIMIFNKVHIVRLRTKGRRWTSKRSGNQQMKRNHKPNSAANSTCFTNFSLALNGEAANIRETRDAFSLYLKRHFIISSFSFHTYFGFSVSSLIVALNFSSSWRSNLSNTIPNPVYSIIPALRGWSPKIGMKMPE